MRVGVLFYRFINLLPTVSGRPHTHAEKLFDGGDQKQRILDGAPSKNEGNWNELM